MESKAKLSDLVARRNSVQTSLVNLMDLGLAHRQNLARQMAGQEPGRFALLVGATFGLWRSAFLVPHPDRPFDLFDDSRKFVADLIRTNAVGYMQDVENHDWSRGYYLNNTILRLDRIDGSTSRFAYNRDINEGEWNRQFERLEKATENLHATLSQSTRLDGETLRAHWQALERAVALRENEVPFRTEPDFLRWLIYRRSEVQVELIELTDLGTKHEHFLKTDAGQEDTWLLALLIGAAYGLWRSALLLAQSSDRPRLLDDALKFSFYLVRNNTIGHMQDVHYREWSGGHYLYNATLRLDLALDKLRPSATTGHSPRSTYALCIDQPHWEHEFSRLKDAIELLRGKIRAQTLSSDNGLLQSAGASGITSGD